jgi:WW domain-binding protein 4
MSSRERQAPWQREQRYYCAACNAWMGNDRQSIMLHENGKKHRENVERAMEERRTNKRQEEKAKQFLSDSLKQMEQAALAGTGGNLGVAQTSNYRPQPVTSAQPSNNYNRYPHPPPPPPPPPQKNYNHRPPFQGINHSIDRSGVPPPPVAGSFPQITQSLNPQSHKNQILQSNNPTSSQLQQERIDWQAKKIKREEINNSKRKTREGEDSDNDEKQDENSNKRPKLTILPGEGFYSYNDTNKNDVKREADVRGTDNALKQKTTTYLEGDIFFGLLEEDMPVQLWTGSSSCRTEKRQRTNVGNWKNALVVQVINHRSETTGERSDELQRPLVHVSYLASQDDTEETIERKISLDRIRIILGADEKIPDSLEEARLLAMGGEETHVTSNINGSETTSNVEQQQIDEATGLSGWSTVSIKKTTHRQEHREERKRFDENKSLASKKREAEQERIAERRLEESRASNADDSALGAYDVWGKMDYKGVDISKEVHYSIEDSAKRLATAKNLTTGTKVAFKKRVKKKGQRAARRRTSADDDD